MNFNLRRRLWLTVFLLAPAPARASGGVLDLYPVRYFRRVGSDIAALPAAVRGWGPRDRTIALAVGAATLAAYSVDDDVVAGLSKHRHDFLSDTSHTFTHFGDFHFEVPIVAGSWALGAATGSRPLRKIGEDGAEASLIAAAIINPAITFLTGRDLPTAGKSATKFRPFTRGRFSFPSGHTTEAFAMAAVIDLNLRESLGYWQTPVVYGAAAAVGISRVNDRRHYLSDVVLGAGIGWSVGTWVARRRRDDSSLTLLPVPGGVRLALRF